MDGALDIEGRVVDDDRVRLGAIGCGSHAFRNVLPTLQFLPVDLVATCDLDARTAGLYAEQFGADRSYDDHAAMLDAEDLDGIVAVLDYDDEGRPRYPGVAADAMHAGCHAWIEKPPAASVEAIEELRRVEAETGKFVQVGYKKVYTPAIEEAKAITDREEFGDVDTISVRYPQALPDRDDPKETLEHGPALVGLLDHVCHPGAILSYLGGSMASVRHRSAGDGGFVTVEFESGAVGTLHMAAGSSGSSPLERVEVVGDGANVVVENGTELTYYRPHDTGAYGRTTEFMGDVEDAPVRWEPEFSLGQLYNKNLVTLGYYGELDAFVDCCREDRPPEKAGTGMSRELLGLYGALLAGEGGAVDL
ncbi:MAG: Gfo/Idh/MocA family protein [Halobacteriales archaeon]